MSWSCLYKGFLAAGTIPWITLPREVHLVPFLSRKQSGLARGWYGYTKLCFSHCFQGGPRWLQQLAERWGKCSSFCFLCLSLCKCGKSKDRNKSDPEMHTKYPSGHFPNVLTLVLCCFLKFCVAVAVALTPNKLCTLVFHLWIWFCLWYFNLFELFALLKLSVSLLSAYPAWWSWGIL